ncbi:MAG: hypothetical protein A2117_00140 [Candidatus Wildermuthbacteria bacterium GWA2_46_15]|jgi:hypothetical protein|uniref:Small-conductance mechanosensitive ion channel n=1 Tax=Candidatus Wildermuthbacteria bacterium GWA2_46_15 TaxID=1802443 RepID=A0A1G2QNA2_9BACT|nr:MAG: hypothetical protein A2117_00140 [Candidatus Wildermuthbacteria bacterium GWA2_46_15]
MPQDWYLVTVQALQDLWLGFLYSIPNLIGAVVVFVVGWVASSWAGWLVTKGLNLVKLNQLFAKGQWDEALERAGIKADVSGFVGQVCRWILVITFLLASVEILGLSQFASFLSRVTAWLPNVVVAVLMLVVAVIVSDILEKIAVASVTKAKIKSVHAVGIVVKWSIYLFAFLAILMQLGVAPSLVEIFFTGIVATMVISGGLAFGLGGKDLAKELLEDLNRKLKS